MPILMHIINHWLFCSQGFGPGTSSLWRQEKPELPEETVITQRASNCYHLFVCLRPSGRIFRSVQAFVASYKKKKKLKGNQKLWKWSCTWIPHVVLQAISIRISNWLTPHAPLTMQIPSSRLSQAARKDLVGPVEHVMQESAQINLN